MSLRLFLQQDLPRTIVLATEQHALVFRHDASDLYRSRDAHATERHSATPQCIVEFVTLSSFDLSTFRQIRISGAHGTLGLISINADIYLCVISGADRVATVRPGEAVQRILSVEFCRLSAPVTPQIAMYDMLTEAKTV